MHDPLAAFDALLADATRLDDFLLAWPNSPLTKAGDDRAVLWFTGAAQQVAVQGDMEPHTALPLTRLGTTDFWYFVGQYEADARLDYRLIADGVGQLDPRNPRQVPSGYDPKSYFVMPGYRAPDVIAPRIGIERGWLVGVDDWVSEAYSSTRDLYIYTPPRHDATRRYPVAFFHDGGDYVEYAGATTIIDNLIAAGRIPPLIAVFVQPSKEWGRVADYDLNEQYVQLICDELLPWVDARLPLDPDPARRAIIGASFGGLIALLIGARRPDLWGNVVTQSGFVGRQADAVLDMLKAAPASLRIHAIIGSYECNVTPQLGSAEADFLAGNRRLHEVLGTHGYPHVYQEFHEGHSWGLWQAQLGAALEFCFAAAV